jgi:small subunit ribosomal protein S7
MSRRRKAQVRAVLPDPKYGDVLVSKFINYLMERGKKSVAEKIVYDALEALAKNAKSDNVLEMFKTAIENARPSVEVRSRRVGGATYQVPVEVAPRRSIALSSRWIINAARKRGQKTMKDKLAAELLDAANGKGDAIKTRDNVTKTAEGNRTFAHFRW